MTLTLAWRNLWRRRRRTLFSVAAIAATCVVLVFLPSLQSGTYTSMIQTYTDLMEGYAQIQNKDYLDTPAMRESFQIDERLQTALDALPADVTVGERGNAYALLTSEKRSLGAQIIGVDPEAEARISTIPSNIKTGHYLQGENQIVLGESLARNLQVGIGDSITLLGVGRDGSLAVDALKVTGLFRTGITDLDRQLAEMSIARFDATFAMEGERHALVLNGKNVQALRDSVDQLRPVAAAQGLALRDWTELQPGLLSAIRLDVTGAVLIYSVLIAVVVLSLLNNLLMSVLERTREFGMMMALGVRPALLSRVVWVEIGLTALMGVALGIFTGSLLTLWYGKQGIEFESAQSIFEQYGMSATLHPELTLLTLSIGPAAVIAALTVAGLIPALRIFRLNIIDSMRGL